MPYSAAKNDQPWVRSTGANSLRTKLRSLSSRIWTKIGHHPGIFFPCNSLRSAKRGVPVTKQTEVVIEGYQRSGNNFAVIAFKQAQRRAVNLAHHLHAPAQIIKAAKLGIPSVVLIRKPVDVACSQVLRSPYITIEKSLSNYIDFHRRIHPYRKKYVVVVFDELISDISVLTTRLNQRFNTQYAPFVPDKENVDNVFERIDWLNQEFEHRDPLRLSRPSSEKREEKKKLQHLFKHEYIKRLVREAERIYTIYSCMAK